jgi:hypothetical protein
VQDLPETQRTALLLREIDALSYEQIAEAMETTVPSVKSLLVRARVSLAEAAEARLLSCEEVREELGEVAEGLTRTSAPVRRHLRTCERCATFRKQLRQTNKALAAIFPVAPMLLLKKTLLAHLGTSAAASGGTAATAGGAAAGGAAVQAGITTLATKTVAGLAAAAIVTAGAVEVKHASHKRDRAALMAAASAAVAPPAQAAVAPPAPAPEQPRSAGDEYKPKHADKDAAVKAPEKPKATATATPTATPTPSSEQHDSATTTLPSETTGSTESGDGVIAPPSDTVSTTVQPSPPPPAADPQPAPTPTPGGPAPTPTPTPTPSPSPTPTPSPGPTPTPSPTPGP